MLGKKSTKRDRTELIPILDELEANRKLFVLDKSTKQRYSITGIRLHGDTVIFEFKGEKVLTRYEFAQALIKTIHKLEAEAGMSRATGVIDEVDVNEVLKKSGLEKKDLALLKKLINEFQKELADMNLRMNEVETKQRNMELSQPKIPLYLSIGAVIISFIALIISIAK